MQPAPNEVWIILTRPNPSTVDFEIKISQDVCKNSEQEALTQALFALAAGIVKKSSQDIPDLVRLGQRIIDAAMEMNNADK